MKIYKNEEGLFIVDLGNRLIDMHNQNMFIGEGCELRGGVFLGYLNTVEAQGSIVLVRQSPAEFKEVKYHWVRFWGSLADYLKRRLTRRQLKLAIPVTEFKQYNSSWKEHYLPLLEAHVDHIKDCIKVKLTVSKKIKKKN